MEDDNIFESMCRNETLTTIRNTEVIFVLLHIKVIQEEWSYYY